MGFGNHFKVLHHSNRLSYLPSDSETRFVPGETVLLVTWLLLLLMLPNGLLIH